MLACPENSKGPVATGDRRASAAGLTFVTRHCGVADCGADLQSTIGHEFNLVEWQAINIEHPCGSLHVQLHQVDQRCAATHESHVRALLRRLRLCCGGDGCRGVCWTDEFEGMHAASCSAFLSSFSNLLNCFDNVGVGAATTDVAAHQFLYRRIVGTTRLFEQRYG